MKISTLVIVPSALFVLGVQAADPSTVLGHQQSGIRTTFASALDWKQLAAEYGMNVAEGDGFGPRKSAVADKSAVNLFGSIRNNLGADICGLVLANGQFQFSCSPNGSYNLTTITDSNNQVGLFGFADGHFPYHVTLGPSGGRYDITLNIASSGGGGGGGGGGTTTTANISFTLTDACHDGYQINYKFYDETNNLVWPSASSYYFTQYDDTPYQSNLQCQVNAKVCYGGRNTNPSSPGYWGVDIDNSKGCSNCCITCASGASLSRSLTC